MLHFKCCIYWDFLVYLLGGQFSSYLFKKGFTQYGQTDSSSSCWHCQMKIWACMYIVRACMKTLDIARFKYCSEVLHSLTYVVLKENKFTHKQVNAWVIGNVKPHEYTSVLFSLLNVAENNYRTNILFSAKLLYFYWNSQLIQNPCNFTMLS